jgi:hypothetical protein
VLGGIVIPVSQFVAARFERDHAAQLYAYLLEHYADS